MKNFLWILAAGLFLFFSACESTENTPAPSPQTPADSLQDVNQSADSIWNQYFSNDTMAGTMVVENLAGDFRYVANPQRADSGYLPASTFKIFNSLVALECNVIDEKTVLKWNGVPNRMWQWDRDFTIREAYKASCVWFYQELARRAGAERMQHWLTACNYGNAVMGDSIDLFWLSGGLRINCHEQISFLKKLWKDELPFRKEVQQRVKNNIMLADSTNAYQLYAKTGWTLRVTGKVGWYVGMVHTDHGDYFFAMNMFMPENRDLNLRKKIVYEMLVNLKVLPEGSSPEL